MELLLLLLLLLLRMVEESKGTVGSEVEKGASSIASSSAGRRWRNEGAIEFFSDIV